MPGEGYGLCEPMYRGMELQRGCVIELVRSGRWRVERVEPNFGLVNSNRRSEGWSVRPAACQSMAGHGAARLETW